MKNSMLLAIAVFAVTSTDFAKEPASIREAAKVIDLSRLPIPRDARIQLLRLALLKYVSREKVAEAFERHQKQLTDAGFTVESTDTPNEEAAKGFFSKSGFRIELTVSPATQPGSIQVQICNLGDFHPQEIPELPKSKLIKNEFNRRLLAVPGKPKDAAELLTEHLATLGWTPLPKPRLWYEFKKNGVKLQATFLLDRDDSSRSLLDLRCEQLSGEIPAPENVELVNLPETSRSALIRFFTSMDEKAIFDFYRNTLKQDGWELRSTEPTPNPFGGVCLVFADKLLGVIRVTVSDFRDQKKVEAEQLSDADWKRVMKMQDEFERSRK